jgi:hypothetical protein
VSERSECAERIADFIKKSGLTNPFGGDVQKSGKYYGVLFAIPRTLNGLVRVYSQKFILVECQGKAAPGYEWKAVYENEAAAIDFLKKAFVDDDVDGALEVAHRES